MRPSPAISLVSATLLALSAATHAAPLSESDAAKKLGTPFAEQAYWEPVFFPREHSRFHWYLDLDFSTHYITSRGLNIENQGVVFQPLLVLSWDAYHRETGFLNDATLSFSLWNSFHSRYSGREPGRWNETDATAALSLTFAHDWKLSAAYSGYFSQTQTFDTAWNLDVALSYDDTKLLGRFALHPYIQYSRETEGKTTVVFRPDRTDESYALQFGIDPGYQFTSIPLKVDFPTFITWVPDNYYQRSTLETKHYQFFGYTYRYQVYDGAGGGSGPGFFSTAARFTLPLKCIPPKAGQWTLYASAQYYRFINDGLLDGNQFLSATTKRQRDLVQFHAGISIYY